MEAVLAPVQVRSRDQGMGAAEVNENGLVAVRAGAIDEPDTCCAGCPPRHTPDLMHAVRSRKCREGSAPSIPGRPPGRLVSRVYSGRWRPGSGSETELVYGYRLGSVFPHKQREGKKESGASERQSALKLAGNIAAHRVSRLIPLKSCMTSPMVLTPKAVWTVVWSSWIAASHM